MENKDDFTFIEGERISLMPLNKDHLNQYVKWANDHEVRHYSRITFPFTREDYKKFIEQEQGRPRKKIQFEVWHKEDSKPIGILELDDINYVNRNASIAYIIGEISYWNKGYATEAGKMLIEYGFNELNLNKLVACVYSPNIGSWKVCEKLGMEREATFRNHEFFDGKYHDVFHYCIFHKDWKKNIKNNQFE